MMDPNQMGMGSGGMGSAGMGSGGMGRSSGMLTMRLLIVGAGAVFGLILLAEGATVIGGFLLAMAVLRLVMILTMRRRIDQRREAFRRNRQAGFGPTPPYGGQPPYGQPGYGPGPFGGAGGPPPTPLPPVPPYQPPPPDDAPPS